MSNSAIISTAAINAAGADKDVQYRDGTVLGGDANLQWDKTTKVLAVGAGAIPEVRTHKFNHSGTKVRSWQSGEPDCVRKIGV